MPRRGRGREENPGAGRAHRLPRAGRPGARGAARGPAGACAGRARRERDSSAARREGGAGDRRRRLDRQRAVPPDRALPAGGAGGFRSSRNRALSDRPGDARAVSRNPVHRRSRQHPQSPAPGGDLPRAPAAIGISRSGLQARADDGGASVRGGGEQRVRDAQCGRSGGARRGGGFRAGELG